MERKTLMTDLIDLPEWHRYHLTLDQSDKQNICEAINVCGDGDHPFADSRTLPHFTVGYVLKCLGKLIDSRDHPFLDIDDEVQRDLINLWAELHSDKEDYESCMSKPFRTYDARNDDGQVTQIVCRYYLAHDKWIPESNELGMGHKYSTPNTAASDIARRHGYRIIKNHG